MRLPFASSGGRIVIAPCLGHEAGGTEAVGQSATRSRYFHVLIASTHRRADTLPWFKAHREMFVVLGRFLMRNRPQFAELCLDRLSEWLEAPEMSAIEPRTRFVYGVPYAAFAALAGVLQSHPADDLEAFRRELVSQSRSGMEEVQSQTDLNLFFEDLYSAFTNGAFGTTAGELKRYFKAEKKEAPHPPGAPNQNQFPWVSGDLYFKPGPVLDVLRHYKRGQGVELPLNQMDLRRQMATQPYWLLPRDGMHRKRFVGKNREGCWGIDLDHHGMGRRSISDSEWAEFLKGTTAPAGFAVLHTDWGDPRHGDLFAIVSKLLAEE